MLSIYYESRKSGKTHVVFPLSYFSYLFCFLCCKIFHVQHGAIFIEAIDDRLASCDFALHDFFR